MINKNFHDAKIKGLYSDEADQKLILQIELSTNEKISLEFIQVAGWDLSPFEEQNVLFEIQEFNSTNLPKWIITDFNVPQEYVDLVLSGERKIFYLEPSVGLGGYLVAKDTHINQLKSRDEK